MTPTPHHTRAGSRAHDDHHLGARRRFLRQLGLLTAGTALVPGAPLSALGSASLTRALAGASGERVLVLIRLKGGNDGLNTVVPLYDYDAYRAARPRLAHRRAGLLNLGDELALPPAFAAAHGLWARGAMRVVNGVGYPEPSLSHFRGTDVLTSASDAREVLTSGWLGRYLDGQYPDYLTDLPPVPPAIQIGGAGSLTFDNPENVSLAVTVNTAEELTGLAARGELHDTASLPDCRYGEELGYLRSVANAAFGFADVIGAAYDRGANADVDYGDGALARQLAAVARLIRGGLGTRLYLVTLDGFDTHAAQADAHDALLAELGGATAAFFADLRAGGKDREVLAATFSEFGRRVAENASGGTDHGTAAPQLLFGPALDGSGTAGELPSVSEPDAGNLGFTTDFRSVYATLLESWLCVPGAEVDAVLGGAFPRIGLGFGCEASGVGEPGVRTIATRLSRTPSGWRVAFAATGGHYEVEVVDLAGRRVWARNVSLAAGDAEVRLATPGGGGYAYRLRGPGGSRASGLLVGG